MICKHWECSYTSCTFKFLLYILVEETDELNEPTDEVKKSTAIDVDVEVAANNLTATDEVMESTTTDVAANTSTTTDEVKVSITTDVN